MKSRTRIRSRWAHCNTPDAKRRRRARIDSAREALAASLPPVDPGPAPLSAWQTVVVFDAHGQPMHTLRLFVPVHARCDQHAAEVDGVRQREVMTATEAGRLVAGWIFKRPSVALQADIRREAVLWAVAHS